MGVGCGGGENNGSGCGQVHAPCVCGVGGGVGSEVCVGRGCLWVDWGGDCGCGRCVCLDMYIRMYVCMYVCMYVSISISISISIVIIIVIFARMLSYGWAHTHTERRTYFCARAPARTHTHTCRWQSAGAARRLARKGGFLGGQTNSQKYSAQWLYKVNILWH